MQHSVKCKRKEHRCYVIKFIALQLSIFCIMLETDVASDIFYTSPIALEEISYVGNF